jgi:hypothetical protein
MSKYCPVCFSEFQEALKTCPNDNVELLHNKRKEIERFVDIYAASNEIEAERIIAFLHDAKIDSKYAKSGISQMPVVSDTAFVVFVAKEHVKKAKALIEHARDDGVISDNGNFI